MLMLILLSPTIYVVFLAHLAARVDMDFLLCWQMRPVFWYLDVDLVLMRSFHKFTLKYLMLSNSLICILLWQYQLMFQGLYIRLELF